MLVDLSTPRWKMFIDSDAPIEAVWDSEELDKSAVDSQPVMLKTSIVIGANRYRTELPIKEVVSRFEKAKLGIETQEY